MALHCEHDGDPGAPLRLVLLHGFSQTGRCWGPLAPALAARYRLVRVDAPGHGGSSAARADLTETARLVAATAGRGVYLGYSMGARMALHVALDHPGAVEGLVLVGGTAGIADDGERAARQRWDRALARRLRTEGVDAFVAWWLDQPMFATLPPWARFDAERRRNGAEGLASSLELAGTGSQRPRWGDLGQLAMPVLVVAGADDPRYASLAGQLQAGIGRNATVALIPGAGHAAHLERPEELLAVLEPWLQRHWPG